MKRRIPARGQQHEIVNIACLDELRELTQASGHPERFQRLVHVYLESLNTEVATMLDTLRMRDSGALRELAHSLKGSSASVGATSLAAFCEMLEQAAEAKQLSEADILVKRIQEQASQVREIMLNQANK